MSDAIIQCSGLRKSYQDGHLSVDVLEHLDLTINLGECIAIVGSSGSGKSTLLHLLGGLDKPSAGEVLIRGRDWQFFSENERCSIRNKHMGFVYQFHHLLREFTALENVAMPVLLSHQSTAIAREKAKHMLVAVGLEQRMHHKPGQLSGGERQRVAIARALVNQPDCVFADEPTGNLDYATAMEVFELMLKLNQQHHAALVIVTHDVQLSSLMDYRMTLRAGKLTREGTVT